MMTNDATTSAPPVLWAIVELFGHQRIAGRVSEQTFGGASFVRVDVPIVTEETERLGAPHLETIPAHTRSFGPAAIYSINWCDEATATISAHAIKHQPISPYSLRSALEGMGANDRQRLLGPALRPEEPEADLF